MKKIPRAKRKLHWVCPSPSHYNDFLFRSLARSPEFELRVHYVSEFSKEYGRGLSPEAGYPARAFQGRVFDWRLLRVVLGDQDSLFLTSCWQDRTCQLVLIALMILQRPYLIWNDAPTPHRRSWPKEMLRSAFLRVAFRRAANILGAGRLALQMFAEMGAPRERLLNFPLCVDVNQFVPANETKLEKTLVLGISARLQRSKGVDIALRALATWSLPVGQSFVFRIAGTGNEERSLRELVGELGLSNRVEFCGWLLPDELPGFYKDLDVYLHPSRFEAYGVAILEALASGVPILASNRTGAALDRVVSGENGFLHRAGDPADLVRTLDQFLALTIDVGSSRVDLQACKLEYSIVSPK